MLLIDLDVVDHELVCGGSRISINQGRDVDASTLAPS